MSERKKALILGATGSIGSAITAGFLRNGFEVRTTSRRRPSHEALVSRLTKMHLPVDQLKHYALDLLPTAHPRATPETLVERMHEDGSSAPISCLAFAVGRPDWDMESETTHDLLSEEGGKALGEHLEIFVLGLRRVLKALLPEMEAQGSVVIIGSSITDVPVANWPPVARYGIAAYDAAKTAQNRLVELFRELPSITNRKIRIHHVVLPAVVDSAFHQGGPLENAVESGTTCDDVAEAVFIALDGDCSTTVKVPRGDGGLEIELHDLL